jgi:hypothetical protein
MNYKMGVDQSFTSAAVVIINRGGDLINAQILKSDPSKNIFDRATHIAIEVVTLAFPHKGNIDVAIEGLAFGGRGDATRDLAGLQFTLVNWITGFICDPVIISPKTAKRVSGCGSSLKEEMVERLPPHIRAHFTEEMNAKKTTGLYDLTDAYWLAVSSMDPTNGIKASEFIKKSKKRKKARK